MQACLFCGGDASEPGHVSRCDGRQGAIEAAIDEPFAFDGDPFPAPPVAGVTAATYAASVEAAATIEPTADTLRAAVLALIRSRGDAGATDDEIQTALALTGNTERPRRWELYKADLIYAAGHRVNARGRKCAVWHAAIAGQYPTPTESERQP